MATHNLHCEDPWFTLIRQGIKPVEGRKGTPVYRQINVGDKIHFTNGESSFLADVTEIREYPSIEAYLKDVNVDKALPGIKTVEEALNIYYQWSTEEKVKEFGFLGIFIKPYKQ